MVFINQIPFLPKTIFVSHCSKFMKLVIFALHWVNGRFIETASSYEYMYKIRVRQRGHYISLTYLFVRLVLNPSTTE